MIWLYGLIIAAIMFIYFSILRFTCRFEWQGREHLEGRSNFIFAVWHRDFSAVFSAFSSMHRNLQVVWLMHPLAYMKPFHFLSRWIGVREFVLGSSGHSGQKALNVLVERVRAGSSTDITPDGPAGPARELKSGVLKLSARSGVPVVSLRIDISYYFTFWWSWDKKRLPLPFTRVRFTFSKPIYIRSEDDLDSRNEIIAGL